MPEITILYDGQCPLCRTEVNWLRSKDKQQLMLFVDIQAPGFDPTPFGKTHSELMASMHVITASGAILTGMDSFRCIYRSLGFGWLADISAWPVLKPLLDKAYELFARHRHWLKWGKRSHMQCDDQTCQRK